MNTELIFLLNSAQPERPLLFVADGDKKWCETVSDTAREAGYDIEIFSRLKDLLARIQTTLPHVLVLDGLLPDGNGIEFLEWLLPRVDENRPHVVFASAVFRKFEHYARLRAVGVDRIVGKPCTPEILRAELLEGIPVLPDTDMNDEDFAPAETSGSFPRDWRVA